MTLAILVQQSGYRTFKALYTEDAQVRLRAEFPGLVSYHRFSELLSRAAACCRGSSLRGHLPGWLDPYTRMKERKKYGLKRARKAPQYTKR